MNNNPAFEHPLSQIIIIAEPGNGLGTTDLHDMGLSIERVCDSSVFPYSGEGLQILGTEASIAMHTEGLRSAVFLSSMVSTRARLVIRLAKGQIFESPLPNTVFLHGIRYDYHAIIHKTGVEIYPTSVATWHEAEDIPLQNNTYQIGDYFPHPKDPSTAIGVVFWLSPGSKGKRGKILSLHATEDAWSTNNAKIINALSIFSGHINMNAILAEDPTRKHFPAFQWCANKGPGWYLPSRYELHILQEQWNTHSMQINKALEAASGHILLEDTYYWCSSESKDAAANKAEAYSFYSKSWASIDKTTTQKVRAIKVF